MPASSSPTFVDLFSGAGGLTHGLVQAGWIPMLGVDNWPDAVRTYSTNFANHSAFLGNVEQLDTTALRSVVPERPDWVVGGPPCQGFSTVGKRIRQDPRNRLVYEFARVVSILKPTGFLIENVLGLRDMRFIDGICDLFSSIGYSVTSMVLPAANYGVPQLRRRVFFVGDAGGRTFNIPKPTHQEDQFVTVWDAISDLPEVDPGCEATQYVLPPQSAYQRALRAGSKTIQGHRASSHPDYLVEAISHIPDGGNRLSIPKHLQPKSGFHNSYSRLHSASPAVAVTQNMGKPSGTRCIHPFQNRGLTAREGARLQGFPDTFHFFGGATSQRLQIANSVSPILAKAIGEALVKETNWNACVTAAE